MTAHLKGYLRYLKAGGFVSIAVSVMGSRRTLGTNQLKEIKTKGYKMIIQLFPDVYKRTPELCSECEEQMAVFGSLCLDCYEDLEHLKAEERLETQAMGKIEKWEGLQ